jgi:hypothetical protein
VDQSIAADQGGGNLESKEVRFGAASSGIFASSTTGTSTGSVDSGRLISVRMLPAQLASSMHASTSFRRSIAGKRAYALASLSFKAGRYAEARSHLHELLATYPGDVPGHRMLSALEETLAGNGSPGGSRVLCKDRFSLTSARSRLGFLDRQVKPVLPDIDLLYMPLHRSVTHSVGARDGLASERNYTFKTLPLGVLRRHRGDLAGSGQVRHCRDVAAAVTNAGGLGVLGAVVAIPAGFKIPLTIIADLNAAVICTGREFGPRRWSMTGTRPRASRGVSVQPNSSWSRTARTGGQGLPTAAPPPVRVCRNAGSGLT